MSKGVVDSAILNYEAAESLGLGTVTRHVMEPSFITGTLILAMNKGRYDALPVDLRAMVDETCGPDVAGKLGTRWDAAEAHGREAMLAAGVKIDTLPPAQVERLREVLRPMVKEAVEAMDKAGKPATAFMADYTRQGRDADRRVDRRAATVAGGGGARRHGVRHGCGRGAEVPAEPADHQCL